MSCCWDETRHTGAEGSHGFETVKVCQSCSINLDTGDISETDCGPVAREGGVGGFDPAIPGGGIFQTPSAPLTPDDTVTPESGGVLNTPQTGGVFSTQPPPTDEGAAGTPPSVDESTPPPTEEGTQPPTLTEEPVPPVCLEGQVLDEQTNLCVLEEPEQSEVEEPEQQSSEEGDGSEDGNNDNDDN